MKIKVLSHLLIKIPMAKFFKSIRRHGSSMKWLNLWNTVAPLTNHMSSRFDCKLFIPLTTPQISPSPNAVTVSKVAFQPRKTTVRSISKVMIINPKLIRPFSSRLSLWRCPNSTIHCLRQPKWKLYNM
jgi:hypothetical protein